MKARREYVRGVGERENPVRGEFKVKKRPSFFKNGTLFVEKKANSNSAHKSYHFQLDFKK